MISYCESNFIKTNSVGKVIFQFFCQNRTDAKPKSVIWPPFWNGKIFCLNMVIFSVWIYRAVFITKSGFLRRFHGAPPRAPTGGKYRGHLRGDYTTRFGNFILYYNFLTNSLKFIKVYIIRKGISQGRQLWYYFFYQKSTFLRKSHLKTRFLPFFFQNRLQKNRNSNNCFIIVSLT